MHSYMFALAACARASINAQPDPLTHDAYCHLLLDYEKLVPHIAPSRSPYGLWHPDLHASNIIVTETTRSCKLTGMIDWQGTLLLPTCPTAGLYLRGAPVELARRWPRARCRSGRPARRPEAAGTACLPSRSEAGAV